MSTASTVSRLTGRNLIAGRWPPASGDQFESHNPAHWDEVIGVFPNAGPKEAEQAVMAAREAYPGWRRTSRIRRAELFDNLAQIVKREQDRLAELMARECGKVISESKAEVIEGLHMIQYVFGTGRIPIGEVVASEIAEKDAFMRRKPWGVVAVITPWNFPFAVPLWMLGPSLLEGNTAVFKPSEDTPAIGQKLVELFEEAGFPPGVLNLVHGDHVPGEALVRNPGVNVVLFTGSYEVGRRIQQLSADFYDRVVAAEMGSKSAVIVCADANLNLAVNASTLSAFKTSGQRCVSAGRILVAEQIFDDFARRYSATAKRLRVGDPLDAGSFTGPVINEAAQEKVLTYNQLARAEGGQVLVEGGKLTGSSLAQGCYLSPFVYRMEYGPKTRT